MAQLLERAVVDVGQGPLEVGRPLLVRLALVQEARHQLEGEAKEARSWVGLCRRWGSCGRWGRLLYEAVILAYVRSSSSILLHWQPCTSSLVAGLLALAGGGGSTQIGQQPASARAVVVASPMEQIVASGALLEALCGSVRDP